MSSGFSTENIDLGGTVRIRHPLETLQIIQPYIQQAGITRIANLTHLDCIGIPVYTCIRPLSKNLSTSQGKGITPELAMCSAYMEGIEHYFSENTQTDLISPLLSIPSEQRIDLNTLPTGMIHTDHLDQHITHWSLCENLLDNPPLYFPTEYFCFDLTQSPLENNFFKKNTTGLASGNNLIEATCHALYECIERHMSYLFSNLPHSEKLARLLDLKSIDYAQAQDLLDRLAFHHIDCVVFDITQTFGVPTFHAIIADENPFRQLGHYSGTGTHLHAGIALCRALTEAIQSRLTYIAGSRDDMFPKDYKMQWQPLKLTGQKLFEFHAEISNFDLNHQYQYLLKILNQQGYSPYRYAYTQPSDLISVVKIMIPGLAL